MEIARGQVPRASERAVMGTALRCFCCCGRCSLSSLRPTRALCAWRACCSSRLAGTGPARKTQSIQDAAKGNVMRSFPMWLPRADAAEEEGRAASEPQTPIDDLWRGSASGAGQASQEAGGRQAAALSSRQPSQARIRESTSCGIGLPTESASEFCTGQSKRARTACVLKRLGLPAVPISATLEHTASVCSWPMSNRPWSLRPPLREILTGSSNGAGPFRTAK
jgi:hypothetical protein